MVKLISFELKKLFSDKATIVIIFALVLFSIVTSFQGVYSQAALDSKVMAYKATYDEQIFSIEKLRDDPTAKNVISNMEESNENLQVYFEAVDSNDKKAILNAELKIEEANLKNILNGSLVGAPINEQKKTVSKLQYLIDNNIEQVFDNDRFAPAINKVSTLLSNFQLFFVIPLLFMVYACTFERRTKSIAFANQVPLSLRNLAASRIFVQVGVGLILTLTPIIVTFLVSLRNGMGSLFYPVVVSGNSLDVVILPIYEFILKSLLLILLSVILVGLLIFLLSRMSGNFFLISSAVLAIVFLNTYRPTEFSFLEKNWHFFPWSYFDGSAILLGGSTYEPLISLQMTFEFGGIILLSCSIVLAVFITLLIIRKQKI